MTLDRSAVTTSAKNSVVVNLATPVVTQHLAPQGTAVSTQANPRSVSNLVVAPTQLQERLAVLVVLTAPVMAVRSASVLAVAPSVCLNPAPLETVRRQVDSATKSDRGSATDAFAQATHSVVQEKSVTPPSSNNSLDKRSALAPHHPHPQSAKLDTIVLTPHNKANLHVTPASPTDASVSPVKHKVPATPVDKNNAKTETSVSALHKPPLMDTVCAHAPTAHVTSAASARTPGTSKYVSAEAQRNAPMAARVKSSPVSITVLVQLVAPTPVVMALVAPAKIAPHALLTANVPLDKAAKVGPVKVETVATTLAKVPKAKAAPHAPLTAAVVQEKAAKMEPASSPPTVVTTLVRVPKAKAAPHAPLTAAVEQEKVVKMEPVSKPKTAVTTLVKVPKVKTAPPAHRTALVAPDNHVSMRPVPPPSTKNLQEMLEQEPPANVKMMNTKTVTPKAKTASVSKERPQGVLDVAVLTVHQLPSPTSSLSSSDSSSSTSDEDVTRCSILEHLAYT